MQSLVKLIWIRHIFDNHLFFFVLIPVFGVLIFIVVTCTSGWTMRPRSSRLRTAFRSMPIRRVITPCTAPSSNFAKVDDGTTESQLKCRSLITRFELSAARNPHDRLFAAHPDHETGSGASSRSGWLFPSGSWMVRAEAGKVDVQFSVIQFPLKNCPGRVRLRRIMDQSGPTLRAFLKDATAPGTCIVTDGWVGYDRPDNHKAVAVGDTPAHEILEWIHRVFSNLKRWGLGVLRGFRCKHLDWQLVE